MKATGAANNADGLVSVLPDANAYGFYCPSDVAVDNDPEHDYFGYVYVAHTTNGGNDGHNDAAKTRTVGMYMFRADLETNETAANANYVQTAYNGGVSWTTSPYGTRPALHRITIGDDGNIYIIEEGAAGTEATVGIYMMNPANPTDNFEPVLALAQKGISYTRPSVGVSKGKGSARKLYLLDNFPSTTLKEYNVGNANNSTVAGDLLLQVSNTPSRVVNRNTDMCAGINNDFWIVQYRSKSDTYPKLVHINSSNTCDFYMGTDAGTSTVVNTVPFPTNETITTEPAVTQNPHVALNAKGDKIAITADQKVWVYSVSCEGGIHLQPLWVSPKEPNKYGTMVEIGGGTGYVEGVAFDYADNLYAASARSERLYAFATPKADNSCVTPAKQTNTITTYPDLNIYASGLNATQQGTKVWLDYTLNATATALDMLFIQGTDTFALPITGAENFTRGVHTGVVITVPDDLATGTYNWAIRATCTPNNTLAKVSTDSEKFQFYGPRGLEVDKNPESPYFGTLYITNSANKITTGLAGDNAFTSNQGHGIYAFDPLLNTLHTDNSVGFNGGIEWAAKNSPFRLCIDSKGMVFVTSPNDGKVYKMDPADKSFTEVGEGLFYRPTGVATMIKSGIERLYVWDYVTALEASRVHSFAYKNGATQTYNFAAVYNLFTVSYESGAPTSTDDYVHKSVVADGRDGFWLAQMTEDNAPEVVHLNNSAAKDYTLPRSSLAGNSTNGYCRRAQINVNADGSLLACATGSSKVFVFKVTYTNNIPSLTKLYEVQMSHKNIDGLAFDYANNLYIASAGSERLYAYAPVKADNSCVTPAKQTNTITTPQKPNIYAFGLSSTIADNEITFNYSLNTKATAVEIQLLRDGELTKTITLNEAADLTKGEHSYTYNLAQLSAGNYTWAIHASAEATQTGLSASTEHEFSIPRGLAVDKYPESPWFGNMYVSDPISATAVGGIWYYDALGNIKGENLGSTGVFTTGLSNPMRICISEEGDPFIADWGDSNPNIRIFNPDNQTFTNVFGGNKSGTQGIFVAANGDQIHGSMVSCYVKGKGAERVLYTVDEDIVLPASLPTPPNNAFHAVCQYNIGELTESWNAAPSAFHYVNPLNTSTIVAGNVKVIFDARGNYFLTQYHLTDNDIYPTLLYIDGTTDEVLYRSDGFFGSAVSMGSLDISADGQYLAMVAQYDIKIYKITYTGNGVPAFELAHTISAGLTRETAYDVAFDYAGNVFVICDGKPVQRFTVGKEDNSCITPAAEQYGFTNGFIVENGTTYIVGDSEHENAVNGVEHFTCAYIEPNGKIIIPADASLVLDYGLDGADDPSKIEIQANANGSGNLIYGNATIPVKASVELYTRASNAEDATAVNRNWQYIGSPLTETPSGALNDYKNSWLMEWNNAEYVWSFLVKNGNMQPFQGYGLTQKGSGGDIYTYTGVLQAPVNQEITLGYAETNNTDYTDKPGFNLLANSWTAPINISKFSIADFVNTDATIYLFNTGNTDNPNGTAGTYTTISVGTAGEAVIAPMEGFFVLANGAGAKLYLDYDRVVRTNTPVNKPNHIRRAANDWTHCALEVAAGQMSDRLSIYEGSEFTNTFDNGYDAIKLFVGETCPQLMAVENDKYLAINALQDLIQAQIAFRAGVNDTEYMLTVTEYNGEEGELYLVDLQTNISIRLTENATYHFIGNNTQPEIRFAIERREIPSGIVDNELPNVYVAGSTLYTTKPCQISIYTADGKLMQHAFVESSLSLQTLPSGAYIARCGAQTLKVIL